MQHLEQHFSGSEAVRDGVIAIADGLTVPFALASGISGASRPRHVVVIVGIAETAAGLVATGAAYAVARFIA